MTSPAARLVGLGLRITGAVAGWVFHRPRWLAPLRLAVLALALVLAANLAGAPSPAGHHHTTTTTTTTTTTHPHHRGQP